LSIKKGLHLKGTKYEIPYLLRDKRFLAGSIVILSIILAGFSPYIFSIPFPKTGECFPPNQPPSSKHILGVDLYGRDWFRLLLYSIMPSLYTGVLAGLVGSFIGILIGFLSAYKGGIIDDALRTITDTVIMIPLWPILVLLSFSVKVYTAEQLALILAAFSWAGAARSIRSQVYSLKERPFVELAKITNLSIFEIMFLEIAPNMLPYIIIGLISSVSGSLLALIGLQLIGLGPPNLVSLGYMIWVCQRGGYYGKGWWWFFMPPILLVVVIFVGLYLINLAIESLSNPRLRKL